ncbi:MAG: hypothetical protein ACK55I_03470, partial [bacterium]
MAPACGVDCSRHSLHPARYSLELCRAARWMRRRRVDGRVRSRSQQEELAVGRTTDKLAAQEGTGRATSFPRAEVILSAVLESNAEPIGGPAHCLLGRKRDPQSSTARALIGRLPRRRHRVRRMQARSVSGRHGCTDGMVEA